MATSLEKRVSELERDADLSDQHRVIVLRSDDDKPPPGFIGKVVRLVFVEPSVEVDEPRLA